MAIKHWRNTVDWDGWKCRPSSYLLSLLIVRAYENACLATEGNLPTSKDVLIRFVKLVQSTQSSRCGIKLCCLFVGLFNRFWAKT